MKKNLFLSMLAVAGMLVATSCTQDEFNEPSAGDYVEAKFTLNTPEGIATRAIGDGTQANVVTCAVFNENGEELKDLRQTVRVSGKTATYETRLVRGQAYRVAFFAYNEDADAYDVEDMTNIKVNGGQLSNVEARDAFTAKVDVAASTFPINKVVTLYRPFAQLNLGASAEDVEAAEKAGLVVTKSQIKVSNVYTAFNAYEDVVAGEPSDVTFAMNVIPTEDLSVDLNGDGIIGEDEKFEYLALNYILVGDAGSEKSLTDIEFVWEDANGTQNNPATTFNNIPVQRNYRTNVVGSILTNPATFNIVIDDKFVDSPASDHVVSIWDGENVDTPEAGADGVYRITSAAEFVGMMNDSKYPNCNKYQNVVLECDIDFGGNTISGFGDDSGFFDGIFDGQGHIISNFKIDATNRTYYAGLFNQVAQYSGENTVIKNLIVKNATVSGSGQVGVIAGGMNGNTVVENCKVYNSTVSAVKKVGAVVGYTAGGTVTGNYAENCTIICSEKEAGEVLGFENTGSTVSNNTFKNIVFNMTATALKAELTPVNGVINITRNYVLSGDWTSLKFSGAITINGNGHSISNLNMPLLAGNAASTLAINGLTIADSHIGIAAVENGLGTGAFICFMDASASVSFNDCHLLNSTVTGKERAAGLIAYSSAKNASFKNCSVEGCNITSVGGAAGLIAYSQSVLEIVDSKVIGTGVEATEDRTGKTALAGAVVGTINANTTFTNVAVSGNTVKNNNATAYSDMVGRVVSGTLTIN